MLPSVTTDPTDAVGIFAAGGTGLAGTPGFGVAACAGATAGDGAGVTPEGGTEGTGLTGLTAPTPPVEEGGIATGEPAGLNAAGGTGLGSGGFAIAFL